MSKQCFIKLKNGEWKSLTGKEFYKFLKTAECKSKHFIDFGDYIIEVSKAEYTEWRKEKDHSDYVNENPKGYKFISFYDDAISDFGSGEDVISDESDDIDTVVFEKFRKETLHLALKELDELEYDIIFTLYLSNSKLNQSELAKKYGVTQSGISRKKKEILKKLKNLLIKIEKSSQ